MDYNVVGIAACLAGFFAWYTYDQKQRLKRAVKQPKPDPMPELHTDSFEEDVQPVLTSAHPANILGPRKMQIITENDAVFVPAELTDVKAETMSLKMFMTGHTPKHKELLRGGRPNISAKPWVEQRAHVVAGEFLKGEGLIPRDQLIEAQEKYFDLWPEPEQHPYKQDAI